MKKMYKARFSHAVTVNVFDRIISKEAFFFHGARSSIDLLWEKLEQKEEWFNGDHYDTITFYDDMGAELATAQKVSDGRIWAIEWHDYDSVMLLEQETG